jgi:hypothetical protein
MTTPFEELEVQRAEIALEFFKTEGAFDRLTNFLPVASRALTHIVGLLSGDAPGTNPLTSAQEVFLKRVTSRNYVNISQMPARVPEGLKGPLLPYLHVLVEAATYASKIVDRLSHYTLVLGSLINEPGAQLNTQIDRKFYSALKVDRDRFTAQLTNLFVAGSTKTDSTYGAVVQRNADWRGVFEALNLVSHAINSVNKRTVNKKVEEAAHYLGIIEQKASRGELTDITPQMVSELAEGAYEVGKDVEYFVAIWYKVQAVTEAINFTISNLNKIYEDK